ncbi:MAG TPA: Lrp/AsnC family transcriptional regulator [Candidatus Bathyarchaeia archaeon]|nr:Lrp/AsnC family transcriptional regulator [Candidatus Bathyarchaeia archaeon]
MPVDGIDGKIIALLQRDASLAYKALAQKLGMNESTVRKRILALQEKRVIKFSVDVDHLKLGFNARSYVGLDVEPSRILQVGRRLTQIPEVRSVSTTLGEHAFLVEVWAEDSDSLSEIINKKLAPVEGVTKISPSILVEKLK